MRPLITRIIRVTFRYGLQWWPHCYLSRALTLVSAFVVPWTTGDLLYLDGFPQLLQILHFALGFTYFALNFLLTPFVFLCLIQRYTAQLRSYGLLAPNASKSAFAVIVVAAVLDAIMLIPAFLFFAAVVWLQIMTWKGTLRMWDGHSVPSFHHVMSADAFFLFSVCYAVGCHVEQFLQVRRSHRLTSHTVKLLRREHTIDTTPAKVRSSGWRTCHLPRFGLRQAQAWWLHHWLSRVSTLIPAMSLVIIIPSLGSMHHGDPCLIAEMDQTACEPFLEITIASTATYFGFVFFLSTWNSYHMLFDHIRQLRYFGPFAFGTNAALWNTAVIVLCDISMLVASMAAVRCFPYLLTGLLDWNKCFTDRALVVSYTLLMIGLVYSLGYQVELLWQTWRNTKKTTHALKAYKEP